MEQEWLPMLLLYRYISYVPHLLESHCWKGSRLVYSVKSLPRLSRSWWSSCPSFLETTIASWATYAGKSPLASLSRCIRKKKKKGPVRGGKGVSLNSQLLVQTLGRSAIFMQHWSSSLYPQDNFKDPFQVWLASKVNMLPPLGLPQGCLESWDMQEHPKSL